MQITLYAFMSKILSSDEFEKYDDQLNNILNRFHTAIFKIINIAMEIDPKNTYIAWVRDKIILVSKVDKEAIIKRVHEKFWFYKEEIINRNTDFFHKAEFSKFIKDDENKSFMYSFVNMIRKKINELNDEQKDVIWDYLQTILGTVIEYKKLILDYKLSES